MGSAFAKTEQRTLVPGTPDGPDLNHEIQAVASQIKAEPFLAGCSEAAVHIEKTTRPAVAYLIALDIDARRVRILPQESMTIASEKYAELEQQNRDKSHLQTVLVSVDSLGDLRTAYPNYYLDVSQFLNELRRIVGPFKVVVGRSR